MLAPDDIALLLKREGSEGYPGEASDSEAAVQRRTQLLAPVLAACQVAWDSSLSVIDLLAEKIGDGSRDGEHQKPKSNLPNCLLPMINPTNIVL
jgi:hypothetical protein